MAFSNLGLSDGVLKAVGDAGYTTPTPIQEKAIPQVLAGRDVLGVAQTGTGKTAGFTLPLIDILAQGRARARMPRTLILEPTRELAAQVAESFETYGKHHKLTMALLIGGVSFDEQYKKLDRGVDVLIATPGRLLDHFERGKLMLTGVQFLVIDEADRMLDMGFIPDVERICKLMPGKRQTLFFSATMPPEIQRLVDRFLKDPVRVAVDPPASAAETVTQSMTVVPSRQKNAVLRTLLKSDDVKNAIIFCNRKRDVDVLWKSLKSHKFNAAALHGDLQQSFRMEVLDKFKNGEVSLLVASDVAARGLDIPKVSHVFNYDVPIHAEDYIHRIGRTGRAGRSGIAITLATSEDGKYVGAITSLLGKEIPRFDVPNVASAELSDEAPTRSRGGGSRGGRGGRKRNSEKPKESAGGKTRRRRGGRQQKPSPAASDQESPPSSKASATEPQKKSPEKAEEKPKRSRRRGGSGTAKPDKDKNPEAVGMGEHVPAFMLRDSKGKG